MSTDESQPIPEPEKKKPTKDHRTSTARIQDGESEASHEVPTEDRDEDDNGNIATQENQHAPPFPSTSQDDTMIRSRPDLKTDISLQEVQIDPLVVSFASRTLRERITKDLMDNSEVNKVISALPRIRDMTDFKQSLTRLNSIQEQVGEDVQSVLIKLLEVMTEVTEYPAKAEGMSILERENYNRLVSKMLFDLRRQAIKELKHISPQKMDFFVAMAYFSHVFWSEVYFSLADTNSVQEINEEEKEKNS